MTYRVIIKVGYCSAHYDFDSASAAGDFATMALRHQIPNEDTKKKQSIMIEVIDPSIVEEEE